MYFKLSYDKKCQNCDNLGLKIKILPLFCLYRKKIVICQICINLIFTYCLFVEKELVMIKGKVHPKNMLISDVRSDKTTKNTVDFFFNIICGSQDICIQS